MITSMIARTKRQFVRGEGNMLLFWGYLCVIVALLQYLLGYLYYGLQVSLPVPPKAIWWLIPIVGIPYTLLFRKRKAGSRNVKTYTDQLTITLWTYVIWLNLATIVIGALFFISGLNVWYVMMLFAFFVVGMAVSVQGMIIKENVMIAGGAFSVVCGGFLVAGMITGASWLMMFTQPLLIISMIIMMIIPGHILNRKARNQ